MICSQKELYLQTKLGDRASDIGKVVELLLPIRKYWELKEKIQQSLYHLDNDEDESEFIKIKKSVLKACTPYAKSEDDRKWLYEISKGNDN